MSLPPLARPAWLAAFLAAIFFVAGLLLARLLLPGWQPAQQPLALLPGLPGPGGAVLAGLLFVGPGMLVALSSLLARRRPGRQAGVAAQLMLLSGIGFALMGWLPLPMGAADAAGRAHALAWMLWLVSAFAAMILQGLSWMTAGLGRCGLLAVLGAVLLGTLCVTNWLPLPGPVAQLVGWGIWLGWAMLVARGGPRMLRDGVR